MADFEERVLPNLIEDSVFMTVQSCIDRAIYWGYRYAGVQDGRQCFAGDTLPTLFAGVCEIPCYDGEGICGGSWAMNIYTTGASGAS